MRERPAREYQINGDELCVLLSESLAHGRPLSFTARGWSMAPFIKDNDLLTVSPLPGHEPQTGDIVACRFPGAGRLVVHRVVGRTGGALLIRGDNTDRPDGTVAREDVLGVVTGIERAGRKVPTGPSPLLIAFLSRTGILRRVLRLLRGMK